MRRTTTGSISTGSVVLALVLGGAGCGDSEPGRNNDNNNHATPICGNGVVEWPEVCDDGNLVNDLTCSASCDAYCGDGARDSVLGEECDGSDLGGASCESLGLGAGNLTCSGCALDTSGCSGACGDGTCAPGESSSCPEDCGAVAVADGGQSTCVTLADGTARCWGSNGSGQLGIGFEPGWSHSPVPVAYSGLSREPAALALGGWHACSVVDGGQVVCWGDNDFGQVGNGNTEDQGTPVLVYGLSGAVSVSGGNYSSCALLGDATVRCWGENGSGSLGVNPALQWSPTPVQVTGLSSVTQIDNGSFHVCAVLADQTARCWGGNQYGQLGTGEVGLEFSSWLPVEVVGLTDVSRISAGSRHTCAIVGAGEIRCWGDNESGCLGDGSNTASPLPVAVVGIDSATRLCAAGMYSCTVLASGRIQCWGGGLAGSLGNGSYSDSNVPVEVQGISDAVEVSCTGSHTCAILGDGTARCWGYGVYGELGDGQAVTSPLPVQPLW